MNNVKHQPATPLPWHLAGGRIRATYVLSDAERAHYSERFQRQIKPGEKMDAIVGEADDNEYKIHAANAYPKLVQALRGAADYIARTCNPTASHAELEAMRNARALLRELGEGP